jgi:hypothetical protein
MIVPLPGQKQSAIQEWAMLTAAILDQAQTLIDNFSRVRRVAGYNDLDALIDATEAGQVVGDSQLTKEQAVTVRAILASFGAWLETPLPDTPAPGLSITPIAGMSRRG